MSWQPGAGNELLRARAAMLARVRSFFARRDVLEVETPLLCSTAATDPGIAAIRSAQTPPRYLQTSPEYAMKRLLAAGSGPIYQIARAFRAGEAGSRHNPEFSMLEWYRPGLDYHQLMDEVVALVQQELGTSPVEKITYRALFQRYAGIDPFTVSIDALRDVASQHVESSLSDERRETWLDLLLSHVIEPALTELPLLLVYEFPASQAALAQVVEREGFSVAQRFELYACGVELANGYQELLDAAELRARMAADNSLRHEQGLPAMPVDELLLAAQECGLPACSGVALGLDRLLMLATGERDIRNVLAFDWQRC